MQFIKHKKRWLLMIAIFINLFFISLLTNPLSINTINIYISSVPMCADDSRKCARSENGVIENGTLASLSAHPGKLNRIGIGTLRKT